MSRCVCKSKDVRKTQGTTEKIYPVMLLDETVWYQKATAGTQTVQPPH